MAISETKICNLALLKLGATRIASLTDGTKNAILCNEFYEPTVDEVLRMHPWNCAIARASLSALDDAPDFGYAYQYTLPTSPYCLRVLQMENLDSEFKIEGRALLTNEGTCNIKYIKRITNPTKFDSILVKAIAARMATELAYPIAQSKTLKEQIAEEFNLVLRAATAGLWSPALRGRVDLAKYYNACQKLENMITRPHGPAFKRPGTYFVREVIGREHVTNGTFDSDTGWSKGTGWSITGGKGVGVAGTESDIYQDPGDLVKGEVYEFIFTLSDRTAGSVTPKVGGTSGTARTINGTYTERITCGSTTVIAVEKSSSFAGKIDNVSVRRVAPKARLESFEFSVIQAYVLEFTDKNLRVYKDKGIILDGGAPVEVSTPYLEADLFELQVTQSADIMYIVHPSYAPRKLTRTSHTAWTLSVISFTASPFSAAGDYPSCVDFYEERLVFANTNNDPQTIWASKSGDYENMTTGTDDDDAFIYTLAAKGVNPIQWIVPQNVLLIGTKGGEWRMSSSSTEDPITVSNVQVKRQSTWGSKNLQALLINDVVLFVQRAGTKVRELAYSFEKDGYVAPNLTILAEHITKGGIVDMAYQQEPSALVWSIRADGYLLGMTYERTQDVVGWHPHFTYNGDDLFESVAVINDTPEDQVWVVVNRTIEGETRRYVEYFKPWAWGNDTKDCFFVDSGLTSDGGNAVNISGATKANPVVITASGFSDGDHVKILSVEGMTELNENVYVVANAGANSFELNDDDGNNIDGTGFTTYVSGGTAQKVAKTYSGLDHLEGRTVEVLADGSTQPDCDVSGGEITISNYANKVHAGLGYTAKLQPMNLEAGQHEGTAQGKIKKISKCTVRLQDTMACKMGTCEDDLEDVLFRSDSDPADAPVPLFTGDKLINAFPGGFNTGGDVLIVSDVALPLTVVAIMPELRTYSG